MKKHDGWTKKKHRSHVNGERYIRNKQLHRRLEAEEKEFQEKFVEKPKQNARWPEIYFLSPPVISRPHANGTALILCAHPHDCEEFHLII